MGRKELAALAALACVATPSVALDNLVEHSPGMKFYVSIPLDARGPKQQAPSYGLQFQGNRPYETVYVDSRMFNFTGGVIEAKFIVAGLVAAGAVAAIAHKDKKTSETRQQQQEQQQLQQQQSGQGDCPVTTSCTQ